MLTSDARLETELEEYNRKINRLETEGTKEEMLEALVNRSTILMLMESYTSSVEDAEDAIDLAEHMEKDGENVDSGTYMKMYEIRGQIVYDTDKELMLSDYSKIVPKLATVKGEVRHYDKRGLINMCIGCSEDLLDYEYFENCVPFLQKGLEFIGNNTDQWSQNMKMRILNLMGQMDNGMGLVDEAINSYTEAISIGEKLDSQSLLIDRMELVNSFINRGDIFETKGVKENLWSDHESAVKILEDMHKKNKLMDIEILINLHQGLATSMMDSGQIERAEKHLLEVVNLGVPGMKEAIREIGLNQ